MMQMSSLPTVCAMQMTAAAGKRFKQPMCMQVRQLQKRRPPHDVAIPYLCYF
jgi:hypothetical protein